MSTKEQTRTRTENFNEKQTELATDDDVQLILLRAKYDLVGWIVGGAIVNAIVAIILKFVA